METKTELLKDSGNASVLSGSEESTVAAVTNDEPERAEKKSPAKKAGARSSGKSTGKKKAAPKATSATPEENEKNPPENAPVADSEPSVISDTTEAKTEKSSAKKPAQKKPAQKKPAKPKTVKPEEKKAEPEASAEAKAESPAHAAETEKKESTDKKPKKAVSARKAAPKKKEPAQKEETAPAQEIPSEPVSEVAAPAEAASAVKAEPTAAPKTEKPEKKPARSHAKKPATKKQVEETPVAEVEKTVEEKEISAPASAEASVEPSEERKTEETVASAPETPAAAEHSAEKAEPVFEHKEKKEETVDVSGTPHDTFVFFSPAQLAAMEEERKQQEALAVKAEEPAVETLSEPVEEAPTEQPAESVTEPAETAEPAPEPLPEEAKPEARPERRPEQKKRNDPHEREVMDKEKARTRIFEVLETAKELERRTLIEEAMKLIPLTDEERADNHPTSLSNRVRSVIGSVLAEQISSGKIVAAGRKLTVPTNANAPEDSDVDPMVESKADPVESGVEATVDIEIEFTSEPIEETPVAEAEPVREEVVETPEAPAAAVEEAIEEPAKAPEVAPAEAPVREASVRRVRQTRGERRPAQTSASGATAVLITEEEIERVILNALRRNSATRNDLLAVLKRTYVEPNRFPRDDESRIYAVADSVLQKLVARGTLQNNDGRYLQKPSQRVLNPGRAPDASFTGNVEARFINELNRQSGDFFEQFAARLLEKYFEMSNVRIDASYVVGGSDDNGIDIMLETTDWLGYKERVFVQAKKRATQPVTLKEVREFYGALCAEEGTRGVFITTSSFCMEASKMIGKIRNLIAIDKRKLFALAEHCEVGLVRDEEGRLLLDENLFLDYDV